MRRSTDLCRPCCEELPRIPAACSRCGMPQPIGVAGVVAAQVDPCHCATAAYSRCFAPFRYEFPVADLVQGLKYQGVLANARVLGTLLARAACEHGHHRRVDLLVPMPLHPSRLVQRGYNQSHEVARFTAHDLDLPCEALALRRTRATSPQVELSRGSRRENVRGAFAAVRPLVAGRRIALVDDVITTGSTADAAAEALRAAGATDVEAWAVARALG